MTRAYQSEAELSPTFVDEVPMREILIASNGALLVNQPARYRSLDEYIWQFSAPLSRLRRACLYSFYDPISPQVTIVLECRLVHVCKRCGEVMDQCECAF